MRRYNTEIEREFVAFLKDQDGKEDGTASTYHRAFWLTRVYTQSLDVIMGSSQNAQEVVDAVDQVRFPDNKCFLPDEVSVGSKEGRERICEVKTRLNQSVFRKWVLGLYGYKCCVTGLNVQEVLRASHIVAWADDKKNRMNPSNCLCLSATYDAAFDRHLISFDEDYRMVLSKSLRDRCPSSVCKTYFESREGLRIDLPDRYLPDQGLLARHRERLAK